MRFKKQNKTKAFRCAYCLFYNEARKTKPTVPKLSNQEPNANESSSSTLSSNSLDDLNNLSDPVSLPSSISASNDVNPKPKSNGHDKQQRKGSVGAILSNNDVNINKKASKSTEKLVSFEDSKALEANKENQATNGLNLKRELRKSISSSTEILE